MVLSMTGFNASTVELVGTKRPIFLSLELKTLNARFFEISCRLPSSISYLEHRFSSLLKSMLIRGRTFLTIRILSHGDELEQVVPALKTVQGYKKAIEIVQKECNIQGTLSLHDIISLPHIFSFEKGKVTQEDEQMLLDAVQTAAEELTHDRSQEGKCLKNDLQQRFAHCRSTITTISLEAKALLEQKKKEVASLNQKADTGDMQARTRLDDMYRVLDKIDVHEELIRFQSHLDAVAQLLNQKQPDKGRRLDFIIQELMREINTITSKCSHYAINSAAVDIKVELEKAREQAQNIV